MNRMSTETFLALLPRAILRTGARPLRVDSIRFVADGREHCPVTLVALYLSGQHFDPYGEGVGQAADTIGLDGETLEAIVDAADDLPGAESQRELRQALLDVWSRGAGAREAEAR